MTSTDRGIAVVGAGPAGLAAAWRLRATGRRVTVYEARPRPGGGLRTEELAGTAADTPVQLLSDGYTRLLELVRDLGVAHLLVPVPGRDALWRGGRAHALRYGSIAGMAASGALPAALKLRMGVRYVPFLERHGRALDLNEPARAAGSGLDEESIADWGRRELGEDFVELLAYPLLAAYYGLTPEDTSAAFFHALARAGMRVRVLGVHGGIGALAEGIAAALADRGVELLPGRDVEAVRPGASGVRLETTTGGVDHDAVVIAVPPGPAARLLPDVAWLEHVRTRASASLVLAAEGPVRTGWFGLSIPRAEDPGGPLAAVCVQDEKGTGVVAAERGSLVLVPTPEEGERWARAEPRVVVDRALPALERVLPGVRDRVIEARLVRLAGGFVPYPGYLSRLAGFDPSVLPPRIALAGDYLVAPTVEGAVRGGLAAAERISRAGW